ncbi:MAG: type II secretion system protein M [Myxococcales bacterium]|nr:type II secretion system protein M [Myxococcales bacterium]
MNLQERWGQLEEREKKLLVLLMALVGAMVVLVVPMGLSFMLSSEREENRAIQEAITSLRENRAALEKRAAERDRIEARYARKAPSLPTFVAQTANQSGLDTPETQDRAMVPHGKHFEERGTQVRFRQVGMLNLATFMEKVENSGYALTITRLNIRTRANRPDEYDAEMIISAFDQKAPAQREEAADDDEEADE